MYLGHVITCLVGNKNVQLEPHSFAYSLHVLVMTSVGSGIKSSVESLYLTCTLRSTSARHPALSLGKYFIHLMLIKPAKFYILFLTFQHFLLLIIWNLLMSSLFRMSFALTMLSLLYPLCKMCIWSKTRSPTKKRNNWMKAYHDIFMESFCTLRFLFIMLWKEWRFVTVTHRS